MFGYIIKCMAGALTVFAISSLIDYQNLSWCLISTLLVLSPDGKDAVTLALSRIKANSIGAGIGLLCLLAGPSTMWTICMGLALTIISCYLLKLEASARTAMAATVIIMLHQQGAHLWNTATDRIIAVLAGCVLGLLITFIFHTLYKPHKNVPAEQKEETV